MFLFVFGKNPKFLDRCPDCSHRKTRKFGKRNSFLDKIITGNGIRKSENPIRTFQKHMFLKFFGKNTLFLGANSYRISTNEVMASTFFLKKAIKHCRIHTDIWGGGELNSRESLPIAPK